MDVVMLLQVSADSAAIIAALAAETQAKYAAHSFYLAAFVALVSGFTLVAAGGAAVWARDAAQAARAQANAAQEELRLLRGERLGESALAALELSRLLVARFPEPPTLGSAASEVLDVLDQIRPRFHDDKPWVPGDHSESTDRRGIEIAKRIVSTTIRSSWINLCMAYGEAYHACEDFHVAWGARSSEIAVADTEERQAALRSLDHMLAESVEFRRAQVALASYAEARSSLLQRLSTLCVDGIE